MLGDGEEANGGCGDVLRELFADACCDCWSLLSLKKSSAGSAGDDI